MNAASRTGTTTIASFPYHEELPPQEKLRLTRLARELRLTDQILSADLDAVAVEYNGPAPAWTTLEGDKVSFAYARMPAPKDAASIAVWLGTNAHELGHVLFSPRRSSTLMYRVLESERTFLAGIANIHNIVEDQRQERLLIARFAPWAGYLVAALSHHIVANNDSAWLLLAGRTWLPDSVRLDARARMAGRFGAVVCDEVARLVGDYQRLIDPGDTEADEAWAILQELHALFADNLPSLPTQCTVMDGGEPDTADPAEESLPPTADESEPQGEGNEAGDGDDGAAGDAGDDDGDGEGEAETSDNAGTGAGTQPGQQGDNAQDQIRKDLADAASAQIDASDEAKADLDSIMDALEHGRSGEKPEGQVRQGHFEDASADAKRLHRAVADALLDLKDESEAGWAKHLDSGRLNVRRLVLTDSPPDTLFDRYEPGQMDAADMEIVLLVDVSASMTRYMSRLGEAMWAIRKAADELEAVTTVISYDSGPHRILADPSERPDGRMFVPAALGGTTPFSALSEAYRILAGSRVTNRLMIVLTDGDWSGQHDDDVIAAMNLAGITTVCALLGHISAIREPETHGCTYAAQIDNPAELALLFKRVAIDRIKSHMR